MEFSQQLATESFSHSWLVDRKPCPIDGNCVEVQSFNFDVPSASPASPVFYEKYIAPVYTDRSNMEALKPSTSVPPSPASLFSFRSSNVSRNNRTLKWEKLPQRMTQRCFGVIKGLCRRIKCGRKSSRVGSLEASSRPIATYWSDVKKINDRMDVSDEARKVKRQSSSPHLSPSHNACCDAESSIREAILYCKRSMEK